MPALSRHSLGGFLHDVFNPPASTMEDRDRKRLFTIYLVLLIFPLVIFGTVQIKTGHYDYGILDYVTATILGVFIGLLRRVKTGRHIFRLTLALLAALLAYWLASGAVKGYASIWVLTFPPFAFFLMGRREGLAWTAIMLFITVLIFFNPRFSTSTFAYPPELISRHLFTFLVIILLTFNYEWVRERYQKAMEGEQAKLRHEKENLARTTDDLEAINQRLNNEIAVRRRTEEELRTHRDHLEELVADRTLQLEKYILKLEEEERRFRLLAENVTDMIWAVDIETRFTFITPSVSMLYGYSVEEAMALPLERWNTPASRDVLFGEYLRQIELEKTGAADPSRSASFQLEQIRKDGSVFPVELRVSFIRDTDGKAIGFVGITRDITDRVQAQLEKEKIQEQLAQAQKMEALGTLVSGLAHDFNNILIGIMGSYDLLGMLLEGAVADNREEIDQYLRIGQDSARRAADLIKQLLALSRKHDIILAPLDITVSLRHIHELCRNSFPKSVELDFHIESKPLVILGDLVQIEQVLLNLCINASHAMTIMRAPGEKQGGVLAMRAERIVPCVGASDRHPEAVRDGRAWILVRVSDTGVGMDAETCQRIYEPFFSKKEKHEGSGIGLTISYNIVHKHQGHIYVRSEPGAGSRFSLYFPVYEQVSRAAGDEVRDDRIVTGSGTILVIDDEPLVLNTAKGFLERCGYDVITAEGAEAGIARYREAHERVAAVLIDLSMPVKSGIEVFRELAAIDPGVRAVLSSGMLDNQSREIAQALGIREFVNKPYLARELSERIRSAIG